MKKYQNWNKKYFTTFDYNNFTSNTFDAKITQKSWFTNLVKSKDLIRNYFNVPKFRLKF